MPALQRSVSMRGAKFYSEGGEIMFVHHIDSSTRDGPRPATDADREAHPEAWEALEAQTPAPAPKRRREASAEA